MHATVVLTPLTVLALLLWTFWPAARRRLGIVTPLAAVERHRMLGEMLLPWTIALFVVAAAQWAWFRYGDARVLSSRGA